MKRSELVGLTKMGVSPRVRAAFSNVRQVGIQGEAMSSAFADLGYKPDDSKGYFEFDVCRALPSSLGPVYPGNYGGFFADTLAASHPSLLHQQVNLNHKVKSYDKDNITQDRIMGCVVATSFPKPPAGGWKIGSDPDAAPCIHGLAVVFKLAQGVNTVMGDHLASRVKQSVSIEATTPRTNISIYRPSTGDLYPLLEPPDDVLDAMAEGPEGCNMPIIGKLNGEQLLVIMGGGGKPINFQGMAMTPRPAESRARITTMHAQRADAELVHIAAEAVPQVMVGKRVRFLSGRLGTILAVYTEGVARLRNQLSLRASADDPVLEIALPDKARVLVRLGTVGDRVLG